jgi:hypothetical protein
VAHHQQPAKGRRRRHLGDDRPAAVVAGPGRQVQVDLVDLEDGPAAGHRGPAVAPVAEQPPGLVGQVVLRPEQLGGLVVGVVHDGFLEGDDVGSQSPQPGGQHLAPCRPVRLVPEQVQ